MSWGSAEAEQSSSSALLLSLVRFCSIQRQSEDKLWPFPVPPETTCQAVVAFDWLGLVMGVAAIHRLEGAEEVENLRPVGEALHLNRVEA